MRNSLYSGLHKNNNIWQISEVWIIALFATSDPHFCHICAAQNIEYVALILLHADGICTARIFFRFVCTARIFFQTFKKWAPWCLRAKTLLICWNRYKRLMLFEKERSCCLKRKTEIFVCTRKLCQCFQWSMSILFISMLVTTIFCFSHIGCWLQIKEKISYLALLETLDSGKPKEEAVGDMVFLIIHIIIIMFSVPKDAPCFIQCFSILS